MWTSLQVFEKARETAEGETTGNDPSLDDLVPDIRY